MQVFLFFIQMHFILLSSSNQTDMIKLIYAGQKYFLALCNHKKREIFQIKKGKITTRLLLKAAGLWKFAACKIISGEDHGISKEREEDGCLPRMWG